MMPGSQASRLCIRLGELKFPRMRKNGQTSSRPWPSGPALNEARGRIVGKAQFRNQDDQTGIERNGSAITDLTLGEHRRRRPPGAIASLDGKQQDENNGGIAASKDKSTQPKRGQVLVFRWCRDQDSNQGHTDFQSVAAVVDTRTFPLICIDFTLT